MSSSLRTFIAIASLSVAACAFDAPLALAAGPIHVHGHKSALHAEERFRVTNRHFPNAHGVQFLDHVVDPLADLILG